MRLSIALLIVLLLGALAAAVAPGDARMAMMVCLGLATGAALRVLLLSLGRLFWPRAADPAPDQAVVKPGTPPRRRIVVDGSNVMYWADETPRLDTLNAVLAALVQRGFAPVVYFDANVGWLLFDRFAGPTEMAQHLPGGLAEVQVVSKGDPADPALIAFALRERLRIVSNDKFRDWRGQFPGVGGKRVLVGGDMRGGAVRLQM